MELADWEQFRGDAHALVDWIIDYRKNLEKYPVVPSVGPNDIYNSLPADPPSEPETFEAVLKDVNEKIMPGITHWQSPNFFAFFPSNSAPSGLLADLLSGGLGVQGMIWQTSPACTEVETLMLDWLAKIIDLPAKFFSNTQKGGGVIQGTASEALLVCLLAARDRVLAGLTLPEGHEQVPTNDKIAVYCSDQTHSSCKKAVMISGIPVANLRAISTAHSKGSLPAKDFIATVEADRLQGLFPSFCCLTVGTTGVGATDEIKEIARYCRENNIWCHIDGAYAGSACICPEYRELIAGVEDCNSFNFNPHKWLLANFDCSCLWIDDRKDILRALSITPEYLRNAASESGAVIDYRDWQIPLGRRFRALKLWFMLRLTGVEKLRTMIRSHVSFAAQFEELVKNDDRFEVPFPRSLGLVTFRLKGDNEINAKLLAAVNLSKQFYLVHTVFDGLYVIRMAIGAYSTQIDHVLACWAHIKSCTDALLSSPSSLSSSE